MKLPLRALGALVALNLPAVAQSFEPGDLYLYTPAFQGGSSSAGAIVRVDPGGGSPELFVDLATASNSKDQIAYDPFRDRLIFYGGFVPNQIVLHLVDANGNFTNIGFDSAAGASTSAFAPRGDGNIYMRTPAAPLEITRLDAANQPHPLLDSTGTVPFSPSGWFASMIQHMEYHAPTNSLVIGTGSNQGICPGGSNQDINIRRLDLSADGTRVLGESCWQYDLQPGQFDGAVVGLTALNGSDLLLTIDNNNNLALPRMVRVDPAAQTAVPYATNGNPFPAATNAGTYSSVRNQAVILATGTDELRAFSEGANGLGIVIATGTGSPGGSGETATLIEIGVGSAPYVMTGLPTTISGSAGGVQNWTMEFGPALAGNFYLVLGSRTGWNPATNYGGVPVPLVADNYTLFTINNAGGPIHPGSVGALDALGRASASLVAPGPLGPAFIGTTAYHATLAFSPALIPLGATNAVPVTIQ